MPKDYDDLKKAITERLVAVVEKQESRRQNAETASALSVVPETGGLAPHELLALTLIYEDHYSGGTRTYSLPDSMLRGGYVKTASNLAVTGLVRKKLVQQRTVSGEDGYGNPYEEDRFFVTDQGENWLMHNQHRLNLRLPSAKDSTTEISDDVDRTHIYESLNTELRSNKRNVIARDFVRDFVPEGLQGACIEFLEERHVPLRTFVKDVQDIRSTKCGFGGECKCLNLLAPQVGLEPTTLRLTAECSAIELLRSEWRQIVLYKSSRQCRVRQKSQSLGPHRSRTWRHQICARPVG